MKTKLADKNNTNNQNKQGVDKSTVVVLGVIGAVMIALVVFLIYTMYDTMQNPTVTSIEDHLQLGENQYKAPDYSTLEAAATAEEAPTEKIEGTIGFDAYYELQKQETKESLDKYKDILGDTLYEAAVAGLETDYFKKAAEYDYNDTLNSFSNIVEQAWLSYALYDKLERDGNEMPEYSGCNNTDDGEDCQLKMFIEKYTADELYTYLMDAHDKWEVCKEVEANLNSVDESYMRLYYQDEIINNYDYLEEAEIEVALINAETAAHGIEELEEAYEAGKLETKKFNLKDNKEIVEYFPLYEDIDYYDDNIKDIASDTIQALFSQDLITTATAVSVDSDVSIEEQLENAQTSTETSEEIDYSKLSNWHVETFTLADRNEQDIIYILWKIVPGSVKHTENIPTLDDLYDTLYPEAKMLVADTLVADAIAAEMQNLDEIEVHDLLRENYGLDIPYDTYDDGTAYLPDVLDEEYTLDASEEFSSDDIADYVLGDSEDTESIEETVEESTATSEVSEEFEGNVTMEEIIETEESASDITDMDATG